MSVTYAFDMDRLPEYLYHGTDCSNISSICEKGILTGSYKTCNPYSEETGTGQSFVEDCIGNVSMAVDPKDAIFFIVANRKSREEFLKPQCILKVRTDKLDTDRLLFRELFNKENGEAKLFRDVPPEAIEGIQIRTFEQKGKKLNVKEEWKTCDLWEE